MSEDETMRPIPRSVLIAAAAMIAITITIAGTAKWTGVGRVTVAPTDTKSVLNLRFEDRRDGSIAISDADTDKIIEVLGPGSSGFVRVVMRSLVRERRLNEADRMIAFRLVRWNDGRLSVEDPATGRSIDLGAFGAENTDAFAQILLAGDAKR